MAEPTTAWAVADAYERYMGRWSLPVARELLPWLGLTGGAVWLDVGCGAGALSETVLRTADPAAVIGVDPSTGFVSHARDRCADARARFLVADAQRLPLGDARCDAVVSGLVLNFVPDPALAVREMARVSRFGGRVGAYVWDYSGRMDLIRCFWDAALALDPSASAEDQSRSFPLCRPGPLAELFEGAGLADVEVRLLEVPTTFRDFDDYWLPFLGGQGPAPTYVMSLDAPHREALRRELRARLPTAPGGAIPLVARAWAVAATHP